MANTKHDKGLAKRLRAGGMRKRAAEVMAGATDGRRKPGKQVRAIVKEMRKALADVEDRAKGGPAKRSEAAKKAARTRKKNQAKAATAKKSAKTNAKEKAATTKAKTAESR